ncbi:hypothetical protein FF38_03314 [Lucilia cuprina]|uniref:Uncharacterized protein n=1 Tax=Lucilia cuprina TaxID=7375 RepID=A0A0L0C4M9_LUCCU|nr:hypothetical protein FF38_03314 [Lucilia cuprina]
MCQESRFLFNPAHLIDSARSVVTGIGNQVVQGIFSPRDLLRGSRQVLFGLPEVAVFRTIHELCSLYLSSGLSKISSAWVREKLVSLQGVRKRKVIKSILGVILGLIVSDAKYREP